MVYTSYSHHQTPFSSSSTPPSAQVCGFRLRSAKHYIFAIILEGRFQHCIPFQLNLDQLPTGWCGTSVKRTRQDPNQRARTMADEDRKSDAPYVCFTQEHTELPIWSSEKESSGPPAINVGIDDPHWGRIVPRWEVSQGKTTLLYYVDASTFQLHGLPDTEVAFAANALQEAADAWNSLNLGIAFSQATSRAETNFALIYEKNGVQTGDRLAEAFFPQDPNQYVIVSDLGLHAKNRNILRNVFLHELGHILGLRHEFALDKQQQLQLGLKRPEDPQGAVQFQNRNPQSVMNYGAIPSLQNSDITAIKAFYMLKTGHLLGGSPVVDFKQRPLP